MRPHGLQPTGLPRPWDSPGKNTGVGCHFLLQCMKVKSESEVAQSCPTRATPWTADYQAPPSMGFSRQKYWSGVPLPSPAGRAGPGTNEGQPGGAALSYSGLHAPRDKELTPNSCVGGEASSHTLQTQSGPPQFAKAQPGPSRSSLVPCHLALPSVAPPALSGACEGLSCMGRSWPVCTAPFHPPQIITGGEVNCFCSDP